MRVLKWVLTWLLQDTEEELYAQYQTDVIDCHPGNDLPPTTFEQFKEYQNQRESNNSEKTTERIHNIQPDPIMVDHSGIMETPMET